MFGDLFSWGHVTSDLEDVLLLQGLFLYHHRFFSTSILLSPCSSKIAIVNFFLKRWNNPDECMKFVQLFQSTLRCKRKVSFAISFSFSSVLCFGLQLANALFAIFTVVSQRQQAIDMLLFYIFRRLSEDHQETSKSLSKFGLRGCPGLTIMKLDPGLIKPEISLHFANKLLKIMKGTFLLHLSIVFADVEKCAS